jgi:hypothetical protein
MVPASGGEIARLPLYLKGNFDLYTGDIEGIHVIWARVLNASETTPDRLIKQGTQMKGLFHMPIIFVFEHLDAYQRKRFIEKRIAFVQPDKQLYIPELLLELNNVSRRDNFSDINIAQLSYPAQCILLYHLQRQSLEGKAFQEIAEILHYSAMTITRMARELDALQLANVKGGKGKCLMFDLEGRDLWYKAFPFLSTPVKETWSCNKSILKEKVLEGGDFALAEYGMLSEYGKKKFAIGKEEFRLLKAHGKLLELDKQYGDYKLEVWHYNPLLLSESNSKLVDKLSLYLSMQEHYDERVSAALDELLNTIKW